MFRLDRNKKTVNIKSKAFTLAEMAVVFILIAIIAGVAVRTIQQKTEYAEQYAYYMTFKNLKHVIGELVADGSNNSGTLEKMLPSVPNSGTVGFCNRLSSKLNSTGAVNCSNTGTTNQNFSLTNGNIFYNLGASPVSDVYTVYIDINGTKGGNVLDKDLMAFKIERSGFVYPATTSIAYNNKTFLSTSVRYKNTSNLNNVKTVWLLKSVSFKEGACKSGWISGASYCTGFSKDSNCTTYGCELVINRP